MRQRADAVRNRSLLVEAGREVFAERGPEAALEEIARRAGVGIGTLYRHFPTREALVEAIYAEHIGEVVTAAEETAAAEDAWRGLESFLEHVLELQARNLPLRAAFLRHGSRAGLAAERRRQILPPLKRLVTRAKEQGALRHDLTVGDLSTAIWSFAPIIEATAETAPDVWRRHLRILLDGMRAAGATPQVVRPLTEPQLEAAMDALRNRYHRRRAAA
jgi:AcrR family transcriptional regulator